MFGTLSFNVAVEVDYHFCCQLKKGFPVREIPSQRLVYASVYCNYFSAGLSVVMRSSHFNMPNMTDMAAMQIIMNTNQHIHSLGIPL